ncbi:hypothetical protein BDF20DRAFT_891711 [Mycotypha africana]|uniref:uncharacterized protein n=1 Tax=Mycotypha africana TaxID=64632 RepID=UPI0022FFCAB7|nr:uncharacterized protein BDF20DRAFT_891711 [Mycotypha africana]KAI8968844.1 hypothetical protein BDF20DRAFT_891711 [Mycotypha africana]
MFMRRGTGRRSVVGFQRGTTRSPCQCFFVFLFEKLHFSNGFFISFLITFLRHLQVFHFLFKNF